MKAWTEAQKHLAGGVNSPVRAFQAVGGDPVFMEQGLGPFLYDNEGRRYTDYCLSWGALLLGHADAGVVDAICRRAVRGTTFGAATEAETALASEIKKAFPALERLRFTSSGTEAVMSAIRLARGVTGRERIVKFEGCYHGHADSLLVKAGSGLATFSATKRSGSVRTARFVDRSLPVPASPAGGRQAGAAPFGGGAPTSAGVPKNLAVLTSVLPYNDVRALEAFFKRQGRETACAIVEPVAGNMGVVPAKKEFLTALRKAASRSGSLLIFDEVISGYRVCYGGAQHVYGIRPDITVLGKIIGGGLPIGAFGAKEDLMGALSPRGKVYQAGTLSGNPVSVAAGLSVLSRLSKDFYRELDRESTAFVREARGLLRGKNACIQSAGSMFTIFFGRKAVSDFSQAARCDTRRFARFFHAMLRNGIYLPPSQFEACFVSAAHGKNELNAALRAFKGFL